MDSYSNYPNVKTIIIAGGKGTRLSQLTSDMPKPMINIKSRPLLYHVMHNAQKYGFNDFIFKTGYLSNKIEEFFGDGSEFDCKIEYFIEKEPLGTAGGLNHLKDSKSIFIILYGDVLLNFNLHKMLDFHLKNNSQATLAIHHSDHPEDSDVVVVDNESRIKKMIHKPGNKEHGSITNAALYILNPECFGHIPESGKFDFGKEILPRIIDSGLRVYGYMSEEYMKDVGTMQRYAEVNDDIEEGKVFNKVEAVFLDRDGIINEEVDLLHKIEDFRLIEGVTDAIRTFNDSNIPAIVVTNQPVIARNLCDESDVEKIHEYMKNELRKGGAYLEYVYYCPHHPEKNHPGSNPKYRIECECRKPKTGMLMQAKKKFGLNLKNCFMIGDTTTDIKTGTDAGCRTILIKTRYKGKDNKHDIKPEYEFDTLMDAAEFIKKYNYSALSAILKDVGKKLERKKRVIILIGGCSRTGKTTLSKDIIDRITSTEHTDKKKISAITISLDNWLIDIDKRPAGSKVYDRFSINEINDSIKRLIEGQDVMIPDYDISSRKRTGHRKFNVGESRIIIIEGVIALDIEELRKMSDIAIFKDERDKIRIERLNRYFADRNIPLEQREKDIADRELEEIPYIKKTSKYAKYIL
ncbi:MAG: HAD-IIIA family hydrolase [Candidatus Woesearchaeota archaeon]